MTYSTPTMGWRHFEMISVEVWDLKSGCFIYLFFMTFYVLIIVWDFFPQNAMQPYFAQTLFELITFILVSRIAGGKQYFMVL